MDLDLDLIVKLIGSLAVVIALLLATLYVMKRQGFAVNDTVHIETSVSVGPKERILLVNCGQKQILVGVTASNIRTLHVMEKGEESQADLQQIDALNMSTDAGSAQDKQALRTNQ